MKMAQQILFVIFVVGLSFSAKAQLAVRVNAKPEKCDVLISIEMENTSKAPLVFGSNGAPWANNMLGMSLLVQRIGPSRELLSQTYGVEDSDAVLRLQPGDVVERSFKLSSRFPDLSSSLKKYDLALFWNYAMGKREWESPVIALGSIRLNRCSLD